MNHSFKEVICKATGADDIFLIEIFTKTVKLRLQNERYGLQGGRGESVVVKHVKLPDKAHHPRGWNSV